MTALEVLIRCKEADADKRRIQRKIDRRRDAMTCLSPQMDHVGGGHGSGAPDRLGEQVSDITSLEAELKARDERYKAEVAAACVLLDPLPDLEGEVLHRYYVRAEKVGLIAFALSLTEGYVRKVKGGGEAKLASTPPEAIQKALPRWYWLEEQGLST